MDRYWLLTNTCYGTWLPGSSRGFVSNVREQRPEDDLTVIRNCHNLPGTPCDEDMPGLEESARAHLKGPPIVLATPQADALFEQFQETAKHRGWEPDAVAIMYNHFHLVVGVPGDPAPSKILGDFKSWGTRKLSSTFGKPASETWWTERGSKRKLKGDTALTDANRYVVYEQPNPLLTWSPETGLHHGLPPKASVEA